MRSGSCRDSCGRDVLVAGTSKTLPPAVYGRVGGGQRVVVHFSTRGTTACNYAGRPLGSMDNVNSAY
ncbi:hypothetical protein SBADM41S_05902 [Streptomyces badius]